MKKTALLIAALLIFGLAAALSAGEKDKPDLSAIRKAVLESGSRASSAGDVQWFKVLVQDGKKGRESVKITLPIGLVELFIRAAKDSHVRFDHGRVDIDIAELWSQLKKSAPGTIVEIEDHGNVVKVWFE